MNYMRFFVVFVIEGSALLAEILACPASRLRPAELLDVQ